MTGTLSNFIVEPFLPHPSDAEYYVCINSAREGDYILFTHEGGVDIGDVDAKALKLSLPVNAPFPSRQTIADNLLKHVPAAKKETLVDFLIRLYSVYADLHFAYLEINPLVVLGGVNGGQPTIHYLDMAAKLDQTAESICGPKWAIARDLSVYEAGSQATTTKGKAVSADRGPPMVSSDSDRCYAFLSTQFSYRSGRLPSAVTSPRRKRTFRSSMPRRVHLSSSLSSTRKVVSGPWSPVVVPPSSTPMLSLPTGSLTSSPTTASTLALPLRVRRMSTLKPFVSASLVHLSTCADAHMQSTL